MIIEDAGDPDCSGISGSICRTFHPRQVRPISNSPSFFTEIKKYRRENGIVHFRDLPPVFHVVPTKQRKLEQDTLPFGQIPSAL